MRFSLVIVGIDPGITGAIAVLADGCFRLFHDMPTRVTKTGRNEVDGGKLADLLQGELEVPAYADARWLVALEYVNAMPPKHGADKACPACGKGGGMGATSAFSFGAGWGRVQGVLESMRMPYELVTPSSWKGGAGMIKTKKDYARTRAAQLYPTSAPYMKLHKHVGRADALLLANHLWMRERAPIAAEKRIEARMSAMPGASAELF